MTAIDSLNEFALELCHMATTAREAATDADAKRDLANLPATIQAIQDLQFWIACNGRNTEVERMGRPLGPKCRCGVMTADQARKKRHVCEYEEYTPCLDNGKLKITIRGSANLNRNPRFETLDITESAEIYDLISREEQSMKVLGQKYTRREVEINTGVHNLFSDADLKQFRTQELQSWRP